MSDWGGGEVLGWDLRLHYQHQMLQVAQGGLQRQQEAGHKIHPGDTVQVGKTSPNFLYYLYFPEKFQLNFVAPLPVV